MESISETLREPVVSFVLLLSVVFVIPPIFERLRVPGLVGLLVAGVCLGSSGLGWLNSDSDTMKLLSDIGKIYLMFIAGLEVDLAQFQQTRNRSLGFGGFTFLLPLLGGIGVGRLFGFDWNAAFLIGSLLASHTLLAYPILRRLGVVGDESVTVTVGATIFTDIGSLVILAVCLGVQSGEFSLAKLAILLGSLAIYSFLILWGIVRLGNIVLPHFKGDETNQFLFVLCAVFLAAVGAQLIGVEKIVGAFLAGLAVNQALGRSPVKEKVEFIGMALFVPIFFIDMGLLLDLNAFEDLLGAIGLPLAVLGCLFLTKFAAVLIAKMLYHYNWLQAMLMWSLSLPQVAATLAAALIGYQAEIINENVFNSVILLMLVTAVVGPLLTAQFGARLATETALAATETLPPDWLAPDSAEVLPTQTKAFSVVVPVYNPKTEGHLVKLAALLADHEAGRVIPLTVVQAQARLDTPQIERSLQHSQQLLGQAELICEELDVEVKPTLRIEPNIGFAISHVSREVDASLIVLGMTPPSQRRSSRLFSSVTDAVLRSAHCSVAISALTESPQSFKRILVPLSNFSPAALRPLRLALILGEQNAAQVTLLHVCNPNFPKEQVVRLRQHLENRMAQLSTKASKINQVEVIPSRNVVETINRVAREHDLLILQTYRQRAGMNSLVLGSRTTPIVQRARGSMILLGEPQAD